jgi:hypothetical protein
MMIGVPYNPIIGETCPSDGAGRRGTRPGVTRGRVARSPDGQSAPDPAEKADKFLSFFAPSRTVTRAQSPTASHHAMPIHPGLTSTVHGHDPDTPCG